MVEIDKRQNQILVKYHQESSRLIPNGPSPLLVRSYALHRGVGAASPKTKAQQSWRLSADLLEPPGRGVKSRIPKPSTSLVSAHMTSFAVFITVSFSTSFSWQ